jgi:hypothetical protein
MALVRLRLLVENENTEVRHAAIAAIRVLAQTSDGMRNQVVRQALSWSTTRSTQLAGHLTTLSLLNAHGDDAVTGEILADVRADSSLGDQISSTWSNLIVDAKTRAAALDVANVWLKQVDAGLLDQEAVLDVVTPVIRRNIGVEGVAPFLVRTETRSEAREALLLRLVRPDAPMKRTHPQGAGS